MQTREFYKIKYSEDKSLLTDTLRVYYLRGKGYGSANGLEALSYENDKLRLYEPIEWERYFASGKVVYVQTKEEDPYNNDTGLLNYNKHSI